MNIKDYKVNDEEILWSGKPNKAVYIKEHIFSPLLIVALIWLAIDFGFIFSTVNISGVSFEMYFLVPFFILHLFPVWFYIGMVITSISRWRNTEYMVTNKAVYVKTGVFTTNCNRKTFQEITNVSVHQGLIDKTHNVGDIYIIAGIQTNRYKGGFNILDIEDYIKVYKLITKTGSDTFSDTYYPNDLRED